ncbi:zinc metallochaperone AztD [Rothia halotolerans]|uniref:zinc metallochaperone AztD n=1 Tax=Rothia halotolerans TaxID=405770 RepID=UPI001EDE37AB|nr:zinc metallochaperone AztD [Rothia halotolerans]
MIGASLVTASALLAGCSGADEASDSSAAPSQEGSSSAAGQEQEASEVDSAQPRLVTTYDGGILTLDANTLEVVGETSLEGFNRVNPAGDGRHALVSTSEGFQLFDAGVWTEPHGDHTHSYAGDPELTDTVYEADKPGHVVRHDGKTVLFSDGDGKIQVFDSESFLDGAPEPTVKEAEEPHHGVAVELPEGQLLHTLGDEEEREGAVVVDAQGDEVARSEECPGVHGEAAAQGEAIALGCEDGILVYKDGSFTKVDAPDSYGRVGNQAGSEQSPVILGDYKVDEDAELERPERVSLTNTQTGELKLVDLGTSYSFKSLGRGPEGQALVLGTDGKLHVIDPESGEVTDSYPVVEAWEEPEEWQEARPSLYVEGDRAYVTEPSGQEVHVVDLTSGEVVKSAEVPHATNEITGVTG